MYVVARRLRIEISVCLLLLTGAFAACAPTITGGDLVASAIVVGSKQWQALPAIQRSTYAFAYNSDYGEMVFDQNGRMYMSYLNGYAYSDNQGASWTKVQLPGGQFTGPLWLEVHVSFDGTKIYLVASGTGIFMSSDSGQTFVLMPISASLTGFPYISMMIDQYRDNHILIESVSTDGAGNLTGGRSFRSTDSGSTWTELTAALNAQGAFALDADLHYGIDFDASSINKIYIYNRNHDYMYTINGGTSFVVGTARGNAFESYMRRTSYLGVERVIVDTDCVQMGTLNLAGGGWSNSTGYTGGCGGPRSVAVNKNDLSTALYAWNNIYRSTDGGQTFSIVAQSPASIQNTIRADHFHAGVFYATEADCSIPGSTGGNWPPQCMKRIYRTADAGLTWKVTGAGPMNPVSTATITPNAAVLLNSGEALVMDELSHVFQVATDSSSVSPLDPSGLQTGGTSATALDLITLSGQTFLHAGSRLFQSADQGASWSWVDQAAHYQDKVIDFRLTPSNWSNSLILLDVNSTNQTSAVWTAATATSGFVEGMLSDPALQKEPVFLAGQIVPTATSNTFWAYLSIHDGCGSCHANTFDGFNGMLTYTGLTTGMASLPLRGSAQNVANVGAFLSKAVTTVNGNLLVAVIAAFVKISTDGGQTWTLPAVPPTGLPIMVAAPPNLDTNIQAVVTTTGVFISTDNGQTWVPSNQGLTSTDIANLSGVWVGSGDYQIILWSQALKKVYVLK